MRAIQSIILSHLKCTIKIFDTYHIEEEFAMSPCFRIILVVVRVIDDFKTVFIYSYLATLYNFMIYVLLMGKGGLSVVDELIWIIYNQLSKPITCLSKLLVDVCLYHLKCN